MTDQKSDQPGGAAIIELARGRISAMRIAPCSGLASSRKAADELEAALDYLATVAVTICDTSPTCDGADGAGTYCPACRITLLDDQTCASVGCPIQGDKPTVAKAAPPKPAPDAKTILYAVLKKYTLQEMIDNIWQDVKEAGIFGGKVQK